MFVISQYTFLVLPDWRGSVTHSRPKPPSIHWGIITVVRSHQTPPSSPAVTDGNTQEIRAFFTDQAWSTMAWQQAYDLVENRGPLMRTYLGLPGRGWHNCTSFFCFGLTGSCQGRFGSSTWAF